MNIQEKQWKPQVQLNKLQAPASSDRWHADREPGQPRRGPDTTMHAKSHCATSESEHVDTLAMESEAFK